MAKVGDQGIVTSTRAGQPSEVVNVARVDKYGTGYDSKGRQITSYDVSGFQAARAKDQTSIQNDAKNWTPDGGFFGGAMSWLSNAVSNIIPSSQQIKKVTNTAVQALSGFAAGGAVGAAAGAARGVYQNSQTGQAQSTDLRNAGQAALIGGTANIVAGAALAGGHALATGVAAKGGVMAALSGFAKKGLVGYLPSLVSGAGQLLQKSAGAIPALLTGMSGKVPGVDSSTPDTVAQDVQTAGAQSVAGYNKGKQWLQKQGIYGQKAATAADSAIRGAVDRVTSNFGGAQPGDTGGTNISAGAPAAPGMSPTVLLAGAGLLVFLFLRKK